MKPLRWQFSVALVFAIFLASLATPVLADEGCGKTYKVQRGDSLYKIAHMCGTTLDAILRWNPQIKNPRKIYPGQIINIPQFIEIKQFSSSTPNLNTIHQYFQDFPAERIIQGDSADQRKPVHWIQVDLKNQRLTAFEDGLPIRTFVVSTGTYRYPTVTGTYDVYLKLELDDMRGPNYYQPDVPWVLYFYKGYSLHGTYWHNRFGTRMSHGCVNLTVSDAKWLFDFADVGTMVYIYD